MWRDYQIGTTAVLEPEWVRLLIHFVGIYFKQGFTQDRNCNCF